MSNIIQTLRDFSEARSLNGAALTAWLTSLGPTRLEAVAKRIEYWEANTHRLPTYDGQRERFVRWSTSNEEAICKALLATEF